MNIQKIKSDKPIEELIKFGILNIDKPSNCTSFDVVEHIRKKLNLKKCGHFGTLDPNVTGVLPICLENACRIQEYFMHRNKIYSGKMKIHQKITRKILEEAMKKFTGVINQLPPRISRVKRAFRQREIIKFELKSFNENKKEAEFTAEVEAGTYIRKLIDDLGKNLGVGAQMTELRRIKAGLFSDRDSEFCPLEDFDRAAEEYQKGNSEKLRKIIIPAEIIAEILPSIEIKPEFLGKLKNGSPIFDEMLADLKKGKKIIETKEPFCAVSGNILAEIAKFSDKFEQKSILAKAEAVLL